MDQIVKGSKFKGSNSKRVKFNGSNSKIVRWSKFNGSDSKDVKINRSDIKWVKILTKPDSFLPVVIFYNWWTPLQ